MNKLIDFSQLGGLETYQDTLGFMQTSYVDAIAALVTGLGDKLIITGVIDLGATVSDGWVVISGKLMPFVGGPKSPNVIIDAILQDESFEDGSVKQIYTTNRARMANIGGFSFSELKRFKTDLLTVNDSDVLASAKAVKKLNDNLLSLLSFENTIILKGCEVSNIDTGAGTLDIAAGAAMLDGAIIATAAYSGAFPVYLKSDGTYVLVQPGAGSFVKFDPYTSQRYADVIKRATTASGKIEMYKTLSDRFGADGIGKWEMLGFKLCDDLGSRVALGYDRRQSPVGAPEWDEAYNTPGEPGGSKQLTFQWGNLPAQNSGACSSGEYGLLRKSAPGESKTPTGFDSNGAGSENDILTSVQRLNLGGAGTPLDIRQPFRVVVMVERI